MRSILMSSTSMNFFLNFLYTTIRSEAACQQYTYMYDRCHLLTQWENELMHDKFITIFKIKLNNYYINNMPFYMIYSPTPNLKYIILFTQFKIPYSLQSTIL